MTVVPINDRELGEATHKRDGEPVGQFQVRYTDPKAWVTELQGDHRLGVIADNVVRLAVVNQRARLDDVVGTPRPGGERSHPWYRNKYVEASYQARGQLIQLSCWCGVALADDVPEEAYRYGRDKSLATALAIQSTTRVVLAALHRLEDIEQRGGGCYVQDGAWTPWPDSPIEELVQEVCATCGLEIYWSNRAWRHDATGRAEAWNDAGMDGRRPRKVLDHLADPEEEGRML